MFTFDNFLNISRACYRASIPKETVLSIKGYHHFLMMSYGRYMKQILVILFLIDFNARKNIFNHFKVVFNFAVTSPGHHNNQLSPECSIGCGRY